MLFPTFAFALFFFCVFQLHWGLAGRPRMRKTMLLAASLFFYGYWSWKFAGMLLASAWINHALAGVIARRGQSGNSPRAGRGPLVLALALNLGLLAFFKYTGFVVADVIFPLLRPLCLGIGGEAVAWLVHAQESLYPWIDKIVLPVGISFFTFQAMSYVIDVCRRKVAPARSWIDFANYLAFFPQLVAGPIVRAEHLVPQMETMPSRRTPIEGGRAMMLILGGLFKKTVVANWLAANLADPVFAWPEVYSGPDLLAGVYGYALQIYCDFSAYSDIAIGTALLLGFRFPDNFNAPYFAADLRDFWRRWHISLSTWLRDYLYIPLGGSRGGSWRTYLNLFITFLLGGLWHGAAWTFLLWGAYHGVYLSLERMVRNRLPRGLPWVRRLPAGVIRWAGQVWIFHVVCLSWILFRGGRLSTVGSILRGIGSWRGREDLVTLWTIPTAVMLLLGFALQVGDGRRLDRLRGWIATWPGWAQGVAGAVLLTLILSLGPEGVAPFIYFQF